MISVTIDERPVPWQRTTGGRHLDPRYKSWKDVAAGIMLQARMPGPMLEGPVVVQVWVKRDRTEAEFWPLQEWIDAGVELYDSDWNTLQRPKGLRGDSDNYLKATLDAANKVIYRDDVQVVRATVTFVNR